MSGFWSLFSPWVFLPIPAIITSWPKFWLSDRDTDKKTDSMPTFKLKEIPLFPWKVRGRSSKQNSLQRPRDQRQKLRQKIVS